MVHRFAGIIFGLVTAVAATAARADGGAVLVVPGKQGVPVIINNYDARWAVVEGEFGLNRPGHVIPTVIGGRFLGAVGSIRRSGYYPATGQTPAQGRHEIEPLADRQLPATAESYSRSWSTMSPEPVPPADLPNPNADAGSGAAPYMPPVIVVPQLGSGRRSHP
jgi:hypothetical protein